jgi:hypothetical protein
MHVDATAMRHNNAVSVSSQAQLALTAPNALLAGDSVTQVVSNTDTYAHWSWQHPTAAATAGKDCAYASNAFQYDFFTGDNQNATQARTQSFFQTTGTRDLKNGWTATSCSGGDFDGLPAVCIIPTSYYPCSPPPSPPPPPPRPPSPPSPPQPASCEHHITNAVCNVDYLDYRQWLQYLSGPTACSVATGQVITMQLVICQGKTCRLGCAGAPTANKTYFCDAATSNCFVVVAAPRNYSSQKSYCSDVLSGTLVAHSSREKQLLVGGCCCSHRLQAWHDYE